MKRHYIDAGLMIVMGLLSITSIVHSATGGEKVGVVLSAIILSLAVGIVASLVSGYRHHTRRAVLPAVIISSICIGVIISVAVTHWPLRVSYVLSRDAFDALAERVRTKEPIPTPMRAGVFAIRHAELSRDGIVCLWIRPDPSGNTGFVQTSPEHLPFNLWSMIRLDDTWQFISED